MSDRNGRLLEYRAQFPILERKTYLVSHSLGAMPRGAVGGLEQYSREWMDEGVAAWNDWWGLPISIGDSIGSLIGAPPDSISMQPNVTLATAVFLSSFDWAGPRNGIVTTELHFPSVLHILDGMRDQGARLTVVPGVDGISIDTDRLIERIDESTQVVNISHVLFRSSFIQNVAAVVEKAHHVGAHVLIDIYQSAGTVPIDLTELGVDAAVGGCLKWLCGGPGNAYLYVRPDLSGRLTPRLTGWMSHAAPFEFKIPPVDRANGGWRFLSGTPSVPAMRAAEAGLEIVTRAGVEAIREKSLRLTGRIIDRSDREGWKVNTPRSDESRGGTVSIDLPAADSMAGSLDDLEIMVDCRPGAGIRMGPHFYNTEDEVDRALDAIAALLAESNS